MKLPHKTLERQLFQRGYRSIIAVDEVGMGSLAGPVVVCAVMFRKSFFRKRSAALNGVRDSKLLSARQREFFASKLVAHPDIQYVVSYSYPKTIDRVNIYQAARQAMKRAVSKLVNSKSEIRNPKQIRNSKSKIRGSLNLKHSNFGIVSSFVLRASNLNLMRRYIVLVDGKNAINGLHVDQLPVVHGDRTVFSIACASVIAKVFRDRMMVRYEKKFPGYEFAKHKGYGTKSHVARLADLGPSVIHRKSFAPVARFMYHIQQNM